MTTEWNNRRDRFDPDGGNFGGSFEAHNEHMGVFHRCHTGDSTLKNSRCEIFEEHNEHMSIFRKSHGSDLKVNVSRRDLINKMWPLLTINSTKETGGSRETLEPDKWPTFTPMWRVAPDKFAQN